MNIRLAIFAVFIVICFVVYRIIKLHSRGQKIFYFIACFALYSIISFIPFENLFYTFPTVESAYYYSCQDAITQVVDGDETTMVLSEGDGENNVVIFPKKDDGWALNSVFSTKMIVGFASEEYTVILLKHRPTKECYICVWSRIPGDHVITDTNGSIFEQTYMTKTRSEYCAYIGTPGATYRLVIDGEEINPLVE